MNTTQYALHTTINGSTQLLGLIGWPVSHSFSPAMHNAAIADLGLNYVYVPLPVRPEEVGTAVPGLATLGFRGVSVTVPHKQSVMPLLDEIEEAAQAIGAVNTIVIDRIAYSVSPDELRNTQYVIRTTGHNTDWSGFLADLAALGVEVNGRDCLVLGAGGSARAVVYALAMSGARVQIAARRVEQANDLLRSMIALGMKGLVASWQISILPDMVSRMTTPLIINTTPLGMTPHVDTSPWPADHPFPDGAFVYDLVYNPQETILMQQARAAGCTAVNGLGMLVHQGAVAFELWTGGKPDVGVMMKEIKRLGD
jgi:shikimate dehydrogenase